MYFREGGLVRSWSVAVGELRGTDLHVIAYRSHVT
jgi:hypothetical protein